MSDNVRRVTIIDDEKEFVNILKEFLERKNFVVSSAHDGISGLELILKGKPDIVLLDLSMPGMDGRDVLRKVRQNEETKNTPIIILSAKDEPFEQEYGMELGASAYITKPYSVHGLMKKIDSLIG
ncbi:MAG: response regulator [Candidatus Omnitrophica bacterium]|nr:response regulator [Candidatus Omnitrophota bacterium]